MQHQKGKQWNIRSQDYYGKMAEEAKSVCSDMPGNKGICLNFATWGNVAGLAKMDGWKKVDGIWKWFWGRWKGAACHPSRTVWSYVKKTRDSLVYDAQVSLTLIYLL